MKAITARICLCIKIFMKIIINFIIIEIKSIILILKINIINIKNSNDYSIIF